MERLASIAAWESFYVIVGSSAAALTGLQFVVITVIGTEAKPVASSAEIGAFGTPTVVHFCATLLVAAILSAPWHALTAAGWGVGLCGIGGLVYTAVVTRRARAQQGYRPVLEDWIWHAILPAVAYVSFLVAAVEILRGPRSSLFVIGGAALLLLFVGIHNAWDAVTYIAVERRGQNR